MTEIQDRAREFEEQVARLVGGRLQPGSGNRPHARLDVAGTSVIVECKDTAAESFRVTTNLLDDVRSAVAGPEASSDSLVPILAVRVGAEGRTYAVVDLHDLIEWLRSPPDLLPATAQDRLRATARTPTLLR